MSQSLDRVIILGPEYDAVKNDLRIMCSKATFLYGQENKLNDVLLSAYSEFAMMEKQYQKTHALLLSNGIPQLDHFINEINNFTKRDGREFFIELQTSELSTYFKTFLMLAKSTLDKLMPLYSYRYYDNLRQFSDKGNRLIKVIKKNKRITHKDEMLSLIEKAKEKWMDDLIGLRDEYAHYTSLNEYRSFWLDYDSIGIEAINDISDFERPIIKINNKDIDASEYLTFVKDELLYFCRDFLGLCDFSDNRRPKRYLHCECGYEFAKKEKVSGKETLTIMGTLELNVRNRTLDYAVIKCPICGEETDTDLDFWRKFGVNVDQKS